MKHPSALSICIVLICLIYVSPISAQWLDFREETSERLSLSTVAFLDDEEKDFSEADLNKDGWTDVIVVRKEPFSLPSEGPKSDLLLMNINGQLVDQTELFAPEFISNPTFARDLYIGDLDNDSWPDIIVANTFSQQPIFYRNQGEDENGNWLGLADESASRFPNLLDDEILFCAVWAGDVNGDQALDLYFSNYRRTGGMGFALDFLLINDGNGVFTDESQARLGALRNSAFGTAVQLYDMDNDGDQDIIKTSTLFDVFPWNDQGVFVLFNDGDGFYENWQNVAPFRPYMFEVDDFNDDGFLDLFVVDDLTDYVIKITDVVPDQSLTYSVEDAGVGGFGGNVHKADLDLDGDMDIAVADVDVDIPPCNSDRNFTLVRNEGGFLYATSGGHPNMGDNGYDFSFLDINNDGLIDILKGACSGYQVFMGNNCELVTSSADFDLDGLADACDVCPTNPDPDCVPEPGFPTVGTDHSIARQWNELLLASIRRDFARPTVHARNLFHTSVAMWDAWAVYDECATTYLLGQTVNDFSCPLDSFPMPMNIEAAQHQAISYAAYRILSHRFINSPQAETLQMAYDTHMDSLGYDINFTSTDYSAGSAAAMGNYIAQCIISYGLQDESNEQGLYGNLFYEPSNPPLIVDLPGNPDIEDLNRWQPLTLDLFIDQSGNQIPGDTPDFLSPEWGYVKPFALDSSDLNIYQRDTNYYWVYHDPGAPPYHAMDGSGDTEDYRWNFTTTLIWSGHLDPNDGVMWDISPNSIGDRSNLPATVAEYPNFYNYLDGGTQSNGHSVNPYTGQAYDVNMVPRADYARVLAEFWADGPDSETPPGHWFSILNYVSDHPALVKKYRGEGDELTDLEWDVKSYLALGGAMHDAAVSAWGIKGWYDYIRPISAIRAMADLGQSSIDSLDNYHPGGLPLIEGYIEIVEPGDPLSGLNNINHGKVKVKAWRGHTAIDNPDTDEAGVDWILAESWEPYQRPSFVSPPFAGYISGHSTYSRAAAEVLTAFTGDAYFPGGIGTFLAPKDEFLVFEDGPSVDVELQWATYRDAADESGLSRIWGGIHPPADDIPGRRIGIEIGLDAFAKAENYFFGSPQIELQSNGTVLANNSQTDFGPIEIDSSSTAINFTIYNRGRQALVFDEELAYEWIFSSSQLAFSSEDLIDFPSQVAPGDSATFSVQFDANEQAIQEATLAFYSNACNDPILSLQFSGRGIAPEIELFNTNQDMPLILGDTLDFAGIEVDSSSELINVIIANLGDADLRFITDPIVSIAGPDALNFGIDQNNAQSILMPNDSFDIDLSFLPSRRGLHEAILTIESSDRDESTYLIYLRGTGLAPEIDLSYEGLNLINEAFVEFPAVEIDSSGEVQTFSIFNNGDIDLDFLTAPVVEVSGPHASEFVLDITAIEASLASGQQVDFSASFNPLDTGLRSAELVIMSTDRDEGTYRVFLSARGLAPEIGLTSDGIVYNSFDVFDFGNVFLDSIAGPQVFVVRNEGTAPLYFDNDPVVEVDNLAFTLEQASLPTILGVGQTAEFSLSFQPNALESYTATMSIASSDRDEANFIIELLGTGVMLPNSVNDPRQEELQLLVYPNPSNNEIYISDLEESIWQEQSYQIFNNQGQLLQTGFLNGIGRISTNQLSAGAYLIVVPKENQMLRARFIKL